MEETQNESNTISIRENNNDISQMEILLVNKANIDFNKLVSSKEKDVQLEKIILKTNNSKKRVELSSEVKFFIQKYLYNNETHEFVLINKDYKNPIKRKINDMKHDEIILRKCLLQLFDEDHVLFILNQQTEPEQYKNAIQSLKLTDEKEEQKFENVIYYRIKVKLIINPFPAEPKKIKDFYSYAKKFYDEIKYWIEKGELTIGEKWTNEIINKIFSMKKEQKKEFNEKKHKETKIKVYEIAKKIFLNKIYCIIKKPSDNKKKDYERAIKFIETEYFKHYKDEYDIYYLKVQGRFAECCIFVNDFEKAQKTIDEINQHCSNLEQTKGVVQTLKENLEKKKKTKKEIYHKALLDSSKDNFQLDDYQWDRSLQEKTLNDYLANNILNKNLSVSHMFNY